MEKGKGGSGKGKERGGTEEEEKGGGEKGEVKEGVGETTAGAQPSIIRAYLSNHVQYYT